MSDLLLMGGGRGSYGELFVYAGNLEFDVIHGEPSARNIILDLSPEGTYDFTIDWGDASSDVITAYDQPEITHQYTAGSYTISISGQIDNTRFPISKYDSGSFSIENINEWGNFKLDTSGTFDNSKFYPGCSIQPYTGDVQDYRYAFNALDAQNVTLDLNGWDTSNATSMESVFAGYSNIGNLLINNWDVSNVTNMSSAFESYNSQGSTTNISNWNVSNVTNFSYMFKLGLNYMLISDITGWDTSSATNMEGMFDGNNTFNQNISTWNVSNVQNFRYMFSENFIFNQPIGSWDMSSATDISQMFNQGSIFNQPIGNWNTSNVTNFIWVFGDVLTNTRTPFNQDISNWVFTSCANNNSLGYFFGFGLFGGTPYCSMSQANYEALLISWASQAVNMPTGMLNIYSDFVYGAGSAAETARNTLVNTYGWIITDGGAV